MPGGVGFAVGINWNDAESFWLNVTNLGLGATALVLMVSLLAAVLYDLLGQTIRALHGHHLQAVKPAGNLP